MSHTVTITRTTTTSSGTAFFLNTGYLRTWPGLLKLAQLLIGAACVGVVAHYATKYGIYGQQNEVLFFFLMSVTFLIGTFCLLLACVISLSSSSLISKTSYELIYHSLAFVLYLAASLTLLIEVNHSKNNRYNRTTYYEPFLAASIMGLVLSVLYLISAYFANRSYRGI